MRDGGLAPWLRRAAPAKARGAVGIALVTDAGMRRLNRVYRRVDKATDVLSFPSGPYVGRTFRSAGHAGPEGPAYVPDIGDIAIATGVARRQARQQGHTFSTELRILALHGLLHLLGYDHKRDSGQMQRAEERLRRRAGLPVGLIRRRR